QRATLRAARRSSENSLAPPAGVQHLLRAVTRRSPPPRLPATSGYPLATLRVALLASLFLALLFCAINRAFAVNPPGSRIADGVFHRLDIGREISELPGLPRQPGPDRPEPFGHQRLTAFAGDGNLGAREVFPEPEHENLEGLGFPQA